MEKALKRIEAMSFTRSEADSKISSLASPIVLHIIKLVGYPSNQSSPHWKKEIASWCEDCSDWGYNLKRGKHFSRSDYRKSLLFSIHDEDQMVNKINRVISNMEKNQKFQNLKLRVEPVRLWIC